MAFRRLVVEVPVFVGLELLIACAPIHRAISHGRVSITLHCCDRPYQWGESCSDHQTRIKDRVEEEELSRHEIVRTAQRRLVCKVNAEHAGGSISLWCRSSLGQYQ